MPSFKTEASLAALVVASLKSEGWDVYEEASTGYAGGRADIVAVKDGLIRIIECKLAMGFPVLNQGRKWAGYAQEIYVAVPWRRGRWQMRQVADLANRTATEMLHIGVIEVKPSGELRYTKPAQWPKIVPKLNEALKNALCPEMQEFAAKAGTSGKFWTPFKGTCKRLREVLDANPSGVSVRDMVGQIEHHYHNDRSARANITKLVKEGVLPGVGLEHRGKTPYLVKVTCDTPQV